MARIICEHLAAPGFSQELHEACVKGVANAVEKNDLCPNCVAWGFGSAIGNLIAKCDDPDKHMLLMREAIHAMFGGYNSMSSARELRIVDITTDEITLGQG